MLDLELIHHYTTSTKFIVTEHFDLEQLWQAELPRLAFRCDYVMHGLLGLAAMHKAFQQPDLSNMLTAAAVDHLDKALVLYRSQPTEATADTADFRFAFTWLVALFAYASPPSRARIDALVEIMLLVKGIASMLSETWMWVAQGPFAPMLNIGLTDIVSVPGDRYVGRIGSLRGEDAYRLTQLQSQAARGYGFRLESSGLYDRTRGNGR